MRQARYTLIVYLLFTAICTAQVLNTPLLVSGEVVDSRGQIVQPGQLRFRIQLETSPNVFLTELSSSCGYSPPIWFAELGNLSVQWRYGDVLIVTLESLELRERISYNWTIDSTATVPRLQLQSIPLEDQIFDFSISDRSVIKNTPLRFTFSSPFSRFTNTKLVIYTQKGLEIYTSNDPRPVAENQFEFQWDGRSTKGSDLRSGLYFYFLSHQNKVMHSGVVGLKNE